jgi:hypothetical protein
MLYPSHALTLLHIFINNNLSFPYLKDIFQMTVNSYVYLMLEYQPMILCQVRNNSQF